jgi:hypothetical protein
MATTAMYQAGSDRREKTRADTAICCLCPPCMTYAGSNLGRTIGRNRGGVGRGVRFEIHLTKGRGPQFIGERV